MRKKYLKYLPLPLTEHIKYDRSKLPNVLIRMIERLGATRLRKGLNSLCNKGHRKMWRYKD